MKTLKIGQSIVLLISLCAYMLLVGFLRDSVIDTKHKLWINITSIGLLVCAVFVRLYFKEKSADKPDYKVYFYYTFFIFLFVLLAILLKK